MARDSVFSVSRNRSGSRSVALNLLAAAVFACIRDAAARVPPSMIRALLAGVCRSLAPFASHSASFGSNIYLALAPLFLSHLLLLYATLVPNCQWWGPVVRRFRNRGARSLADDRRRPFARAHRSRCSISSTIRGARDLFCHRPTRGRASALNHGNLTRGHALANHTYTHPSAHVLVRRPSDEFARRSSSCAEPCGRRRSGPRFFFARPRELKNPFVHPALKAARNAP